MSQLSPNSKLPVRVVARARASEIMGWAGGRLRVRIAAPPEAGRANAALEALLAAELGLRARHVRVVAGFTAPLKLVAIEGLEQSDLDARLGRVAQ